MNFKIWIYKKVANFLWGTNISKVFGVRRIHIYIKKKVLLQKITINNHTLFLDEGDSLNLTVNEEFSSEDPNKIVELLVEMGADLDVFQALMISSICTKACVLRMKESDSQELQDIYDLVGEEMVIEQEKGWEEFGNQLKKMIEDIDRRKNIKLVV